METAYTSKDVVQMAVQAKEKGTELYLALARNSENFHVGQPEPHSGGYAKHPSSSSASRAEF